MPFTCAPEFKEWFAFKIGPEHKAAVGHWFVLQLQRIKQDLVHDSKAFSKWYRKQLKLLLAADILL